MSAMRKEPSRFTAGVAQIGAPVSSSPSGVDPDGSGYWSFDLGAAAYASAWGIQVVSCNTHNLSILVDTLALKDKGPSNLVEGRFVCMRRSNDISQDGSFAPSPIVGKHKDPRFGTHHARATERQHIVVARIPGAAIARHQERAVFEKDHRV